MEMPRPTDKHRQLERLAGNWVGDETVHPGPYGPGATAKGRMTARMDIDGFFLIQDYVQERDGQITYRGHGIFGWDGQQQGYTWYWVDSMGFVPPSPSRGEWKGDTLTLEHAPLGDRRGRYIHRFLDQDTYTFTIENSQDGGKTWHRFMEATYHRG